MKQLTALYDLDLIQTRFYFLKQVSEKLGVNFLFPVKSFPHSRILKMAGTYCNGFEVSNWHEWQLVQKSLTDSKLKNKTLWENAPALGQCLSGIRSLKRYVRTASSLDQLKLAPGQSDFSWCLRISIQAISKKHKPSRFGFSEQEISAIPEKVLKQISSVSCHFENRSKNVSDFVMVAVGLKKMIKKYKIPVTSVNLGGSFGVMTESEIIAMIKQIRAIFPDEEVFFEPGNWISQKTGYLNSKILSVKRIKGAADVVLDVSRLVHLRWTSAMLPKSFVFGKEKIAINVYGLSCSESDFVGQFMIADSSLLKPGASLVLSGLSGYAYALSSPFNGILPFSIQFKRGLAKRIW